ncbi:MAG: hypothetical protein QNJ81_04060 [Acidimicrobiia bacterium]|nr:hypothetical protein [Acidimicrobiia bacterium]
MRVVAAAVLLLVALAACGTDDESVATTETAAGCAHVIGATITAAGDGYEIAATVSSTETGWDKYADAWEVRDPGGVVLAERVLAHPHETEQPFTRSLSGVSIPAGTDTVTIAAHDSVLGFCGDTFTLEVPQQ